MRVQIAEKSGFCGGVRRAIESAERASDKGRIYCLGPLVHNPAVVERLQERGIETVNALEEVTEGTLIIRSHGVGPALLASATERGLDIIDLTCPHVLRVQKLASQLSKDGYQVLVLGEREHPEVIGIVGWSGGKGIVVGSLEEVKQLPPFPRVALVAQTTQDVELLQSIAAYLVRITPELVIHNTICLSSVQRREATRALAANVDLMLVVGGRDSANTRRLKEACQEMGTVTYQVETAVELRAEWFRGENMIGVTAGASTPDWIIEEVIRTMEELERDTQPVTATPETPENTEVNVPSEESMASAVEQMDMGVEFDNRFRRLVRGDVAHGVVVQLGDDGVLVDVGYKSEGFIPLRELSNRLIENPAEVVKVGDEVDVFVDKVEAEGNLVLSIRKAAYAKSFDTLQAKFESGEPIDCFVAEVVKGGLVCDIGARGFIPASQVGRRYIADLKQFVGQILPCRIIEFDPSKRKVVLSNRVVAQEIYEKSRVEAYDRLQPGEVVSGKVTRLTDFGAFVDLGDGVEGLIHVSEMSWTRIKHPSEVLAEGVDVQVTILGVDKEKGRISLGLKQAQANPWSSIDEKYHVGDILDVRVLRTAPFGAFVELEPGLEGLVHISQLADHRVNKVEEVVKPGDMVKAKILEVKMAEKRLSLSIKEAVSDVDRAEIEAQMAKFNAESSDTKPTTDTEAPVTAPEADSESAEQE